jgi:DNA-binding XRE family transcriptional regulator
MRDVMNTATIDGKKFVLVPVEQYRHLAAGAKVVVAESELPPLPKRDRAGNVSAVEFARATMARKIIIARRQKGMTQAALARAAGISAAGLNRIEKAKVTADTATIAKIAALLDL